MNTLFTDRKTTLVLVGPALLVYSLVMLIPVLTSLGYTFFTGSPIVGFTFNGVKNFATLVGDPAVWQALGFTIAYALTITIGQVALGYLLSLLYVFVLKNGGSVVRTLVFFPVVLPTVAVALLFQRLFQIAPQDGLVNSFLNLFGIQSVDWLGAGGSAFFVLIVMDLWRSAGFYAVLLYTGLLDIPDDVLESARIDGASTWRLIRSIILPLSLPVLLSSLIFSINGTLKVFDSVLALTNGGPGTSTTPLTLYMYNTAFSYGDYGYGSTIALLLTILSLLVTVFIFRTSRRDLTKG